MWAQILVTQTHILFPCISRYDRGIAVNWSNETEMIIVLLPVCQICCILSMTVWNGYDPIIFEKAELFPGLPQFQIMLDYTEVTERGLMDCSSKYCLKLLRSPLVYFPVIPFQSSSYYVPQDDHVKYFAIDKCGMEWRGIRQKAERQ